MDQNAISRIPRETIKSYVRALYSLQSFWKEKKAIVLQQFAEMKATGLGSTELNREVYDKLDDDILQMKAELKWPWHPASA